MSRVEEVLPPCFGPTPGNCRFWRSTIWANRATRRPPSPTARFFSAHTATFTASQRTDEFVTTGRTPESHASARNGLPAPLSKDYNGHKRPRLPCCPAAASGLCVWRRYELPENHAHADAGADRRAVPGTDGADLFRRAHLLRRVAGTREPLRRRFAGVGCKERRPRCADDVQLPAVRRRLLRGAQGRRHRDGDQLDVHLTRGRPPVA